ncbi:polysaccharide lyase beta-sandwich domain-containing protein [Paenibacillus filicis]|uniref:Polysaccharide lyase beta-sandwich domain-containing protein n=1 Tax=Paenibacillus gyeongsangnamensis TaxID=3388067 RepID=A0ABT4Q2J0_9BACL|nr:polysaccharide lyase family 8 super-sandwich domain-containing protein [Paenibacillus filicis]MCZ8511099.1 polysaccharide lyase beta-sandwich domain-containing protein [Paenibacillus filicis]
MTNGSFEQTTSVLDANWSGVTSPAPAGWGLWIPTGSGKAPNQTVNVTLDPTQYHEGSKSILFDAFATSRVSVSQSVTSVTAGKSYRLKMWVKTDNVTGTGAYFRTQYYNTSKVGDGPASAKLLGTNDWTLQQVFMTIPAGVTRLVIEPFLETGKGKVWFDDISLEEYNGITGIALDQTAFSMAKGSTVTLTPTFIPASAADQSVVWSSSNPNAATVDGNGIVTGVGLGSATVTVATPDGTIKAQCLVNVESDETIQSYSQLRLKWYDKLTGGIHNSTDDPDIQANLSKLADSVTNSNANGYWDLMNNAANRTSVWSDLSSTTDTAQTTSSYGRLKAMALAYSIEGSRLYHNAALRDDIVSTLDWLYANRYNETKGEISNWWDWEIGTPQILNDIMVLMYDDLAPAQITKYIKAIDRFVPDPKKRTLNNVTETGANLLDKALVVTMRGVIGSNSAKITQGRDSIGPEFAYTDHGDGVYKDGSLVQHTNIAYTAGYGAVWLSRAADMTFLLNGSPWPVTDPNVNHVYDWVKDTFEPIIYKGLFMDMVNGRGISRQSSGSARSTIVTLLRLAEGAPADVALSIKRMVKEWIGSDTTYANYYDGLGIYELTLVKSVMNDAGIQPRGELIKNQVFAGMDRIVHLRDGYGFGLSMFSNRISDFEKGNDENLKGWYTGIGMTYLYDKDLNQYRGDFWPTVDSFRLPGTTTDGSGKGVKPGEWKSYMNPRTWVGGSSIDGLYGAAGMDFSLSQTTGSDLQGKKSWFMFDDEIVALGAGISSTTAGTPPVETIIDNRKLNDAGDNTLTINGTVESSQLGWSETMSNVKWAHLAGNVPGTDIGYYFPEASSVYGLREARTGAWKDINSGQSATPVTRNYLSLAFEHGTAPSNASYSYVILPHKSPAETALYSSAPDVEVLSNTTDVHAVREKKLGITAANFWNPASVGYISVSNPASVMVKETETELTVAVSDPTQKQSTIALELNKAGLSVVRTDDTVSVEQTVPSLKLTVQVAGSLGKTHVVTFKKDTTPPVTTDNAKPGWQRTAQTVTLTASDDASGVLKTLYSLDNGTFTEGNTITLAEDGVHQILYYSIDNAGNQEAIKTAVVKIDTTGPIIVPTVTMDVYWTDGGTLQFDISDPVSGVASDSLVLDGVQVARPFAFSPLSLSIGEHTVLVKAVDAAGNETNASFFLHVRTDADHLDEAVRFAFQQSWIANEGMMNSLLSKIESIRRQADRTQKKNEWNALENHIRAQSGKEIDAAFAEKLLNVIAYLKS